MESPKGVVTPHTDGAVPGARTATRVDEELKVGAMTLDETPETEEETLETEAIWNEILYDVTIQRMIHACMERPLDEPQLMQTCIETYGTLDANKACIQRKMSLVRTMGNTVVNGVLDGMVDRIRGATDLQTLMELEDDIDAMFDEALAERDDLTSDQMSHLLISVG